MSFVHCVQQRPHTQLLAFFPFRRKLWTDVSSGAQYCGVSVLVLRHLLPDILQLSLPTNGRQPRCRNNSTPFVILCHIHFPHQNYLPISHAVTLLLPHFTYSKHTWLIETELKVLGQECLTFEFGRIVVSDSV